MSSETHQIVRYRNRKLYSTNLSRYINLISDNPEELTIETLLKNNINFSVTDHVSGVDITKKTISSLVGNKIKQNPNLGIQVFNFITNINEGAVNDTINV